MSEASFIIALFLIELQCLEFLWRTNKKNRKKQTPEERAEAFSVEDAAEENKDETK